MKLLQLQRFKEGMRTAAVSPWQAVSGVDTDALFVSFRFPANIAPRSLQFSFS
jgi:hypothetical protein